MDLALSSDISVNCGSDARCHRPDLPNRARSNSMLRLAIVFLIIALIAGVFGFGGIHEASASIAQVLFFIFLVLFLVSLITGRRKV
jgi:uncharacterized membrane protein YtjA (UPF0391 family)